MAEVFGERRRHLPGDAETQIAELKLRQRLKMGNLPPGVGQRLATMGAVALVLPLPEDWPVLPIRPPSGPPTGFVRPQHADAVVAGAALRRSRGRGSGHVSLPGKGHGVDRLPLRIRPGPSGGLAAIVKQPKAAVATKKPARPKSAGASSAAARKDMPEKPRSRPASANASSRAASTVSARVRKKGPSRKKQLLAARAKAMADVLGFDALLRKHGPNNDGGIPIGKVVDHLRGNAFFDEAVTAELTYDYLEALSNGTVDATFICDVEPLCMKGAVGKLHIYAMLGWAAERRGTTCAESISKVVNRGRLWSAPPPRRGSKAPKGRKKSRGRSRSAEPKTAALAPALAPALAG